MTPWKRTLRSPCLERCPLTEDGANPAAVALRDPADQCAAGRVILPISAGSWSDEHIAALRRSLDDAFAPDVDLDHGTLTYTIVRGELVAADEAKAKPRERTP